MKLILPAIISILMLSACSHDKDYRKDKKVDITASSRITQEGLEMMTQTWPETSKIAIQSLRARYGLPSAVTEDMVVWNQSSPFKRSIVYREETVHQFPMEHSDILLQTVDYRVPQNRVDELARFDGSLIVDRTKGELSARDENEQMNILALNLADRIVRGEMTPEKARREYRKNAEAFSMGTSNPIVTSLHFSSQENAGDPDSSMQSMEEKPQHRMHRKIKQSEDVEEVIEQ